MPVEIEIIETTIEVDGSDTKVLFTKLSINQVMADVNEFSFLWQLPDGEVTLDTLMTFYTDNLAKDITISIGSGFTFKGVISAINCVNQSISGAQYEVTGFGQFVKLDQEKICNSFSKKKYKQIVEGLNKVSEAVLKAEPTMTDDLFYTVQYNQTVFEFYKMMAVRYGEWMYYTGTEMKIGKPAGDVLTLKEGKDITNVSLNAKILKTSTQTVAFDHYKGEAVKNSQPALSSSGFTDLSLKAGEKAFKDQEAQGFISNVPNNALIEKRNALKQKSALSNTVQFFASSHMPNILLGGKIKVQNAGGKDIGEFIVVEIHHEALSKTKYSNKFTAIPAHVEVPPYTDPDVFPVCNAQYAIVVDNEDKDGLDRIKVHFPWQKDSETSPWLNVITPHAGKGKGFRFLPEKKDEVMIDFVDRNAEKPFILGALHTEKNKSATPHDGNNVKVIGTRSGRRFEIDDANGIISLSDMNKDGFGNRVALLKGGKKFASIDMVSGTDEENYTQFDLNSGESASWEICKGGNRVLVIEMIAEREEIGIWGDGVLEINMAKKVIIESRGPLEIKAATSIDIEANEINMKAANININADMKAEIKGLTVSADASAQLQLKGGAMAELQAPIVKIN